VAALSETRKAVLAEIVIRKAIAGAGGASG
jgi:hypothetical protein